MSSTERSSSESSSAVGAIGRGVDSTASGAHRAIDRANEAVHPVVDSLSSGAHHAVDALGSAATAAAAAIDHKSTQVHAAQQRVTKSTRELVQENPLAAIGVALAAGYLLSWILKAR
ncbi:MAG: hypothetical protein MEQ07_10320 [Aquimonas sp.]|nr:hypothetical protein [Aquimonas sp.]